MRLFLSASRFVFRVGSGITAKRAFSQSLKRPTAAHAACPLDPKASNAYGEPPIRLEANRSQTKRNVKLAPAHWLDFVLLRRFALFAARAAICRNPGLRLRLATILAAGSVLFAYGTQAQAPVFMGAAYPLGGGFTTSGAVPADGSKEIGRASCRERV